MKRVLGGLLTGAFLLLGPGLATHVHADDGSAPVESDCVACVFSHASAVDAAPAKVPSATPAILDFTSADIPTAPSNPRARQGGSRDPPLDA